MLKILGFVCLVLVSTAARADKKAADACAAGLQGVAKLVYTATKLKLTQTGTKPVTSSTSLHQFVSAQANKMVQAGQIGEPTSRELATATACLVRLY